MKMIFVGLCCLISTMAISADSKFSVYGYYRCKSWAESYSDKDVQDFNVYTGGWLAGFVSAYNYSTGRDNFRGVNISILAEYIAQYCISNPDKDVVDGLNEIKKKLKN